MDKLSLELILLVIDYLKEPLAPYATISRTWQCMIESRTFSQVRVEIDALDLFETAFAPAQARRRQTLRRLDLQVRMPSNRLEKPDYRKNFAVFRQALIALLRYLASWEVTETPFELSLKHIPPHDHQLYASSTRWLRAAEDARSSGRCLTLRDLGMEDLPTVLCVRHLSWCFSCSRYISVNTVSHISGRFLALEKLHLECWDYPKKPHSLRRERRTALADGLNSLHSLPRLKKLQIIDRGRFDYQNHSAVLQDFRDDQGVDVLCEAVRRLAQAGILEELELEDVLVSADLFRDARLAPDAADATTWPSLERLRITSGIEAPDGTWYWTGDPDAVPPARVISPECADLWLDGESEPESEDEDERGHYWRTALDPETYNPLARAFTDAVLRMPRLKTARLEIGKRSKDVMTSVLECAEAGQPLEWDGYITDATPAASSSGSGGSSGCRRWRMNVDKRGGWELPDDLLDKWNEWVGPNGTAGVVSWKQVAWGSLGL
ncbi:hypothetical protein PG996_010609 [Apiospora saccharicola]|uniref:F-box domain-containing protein n=1 Tax=Apiospora saccharicola TaxID=335842 RepID=A0ABR1US64_9PEZI